jgi:cytochrome c5
MFMNANMRVDDRSPFVRRPRRLILAAVLAFAAPVVLQEAGAQGGGRSGKEVVDAVCLSCHGTGANGAPKIGNRNAWSKRASQGLTGLTQNALKGIRQMPAHGGNPGLTDLEIGRAVTYMVNRSGGRWVEPISEKDMAAERSGEQVVKSQCTKCHQDGAGGAPRIGDKNAWVPRMKQGLDYLVRSAIRGHGGMPPRGGAANLTDSEIRAAITYMFNPVASPAGDSRGARGATSAAAAKAVKSDPNHKTVGGMEIFLGFAPAESLLAFPEQSIERTMHGGVPKGPGYYHVNVSLFERASNAPINGAQVEIQVEQAGITSESKALEPMAVGAASYGNYMRMKAKTPYLITVRVRTPESSRTIEARFDHRLD